MVYKITFFLLSTSLFLIIPIFSSSNKATHFLDLVRSGDCQAISAFYENEKNNASLNNHSLFAVAPYQFPLMLVALQEAQSDTVASTLITLYGIGWLTQNAMQFDDAQAIEKLIGIGFVKKQSASFNLLLNDAAYWHALSIVKYLLEQGADINNLTDARTTPLHGAMNKESAKIALQTKLGSELYNNKGAETIELLLSRGAKFNIKDCNGETAADYVHRLFRDEKPYIDDKLFALLNRITHFERGSVEDRKKQIAIDLKELEKLYSVDNPFYDKILVYIKKAELKQLNQLIASKKISINEYIERRPLLFWAVSFQNLKALRYLLSKGANVNLQEERYYRRTALFYAFFELKTQICMNKDYKQAAGIVSLLCKYGARSDIPFMYNDTLAHDVKDFMETLDFANLDSNTQQLIAQLA